MRMVNPASPPTRKKMVPMISQLRRSMSSPRHNPRKVRPMDKSALARRTHLKRSQPKRSILRLKHDTHESHFQQVYLPISHNDVG